MYTSQATVHFGGMAVSNMIIGLMAPPIRTTLFMASGVGQANVNSKALSYIIVDKPQY